jgi:hypothetical protein
VAAIRLDDDHPGLRCRHQRAPGRQLVRLGYASPGFGWSASYRVGCAASGDPAAPLTPRYTIVAPGLATPRAATAAGGRAPDGRSPAEAWRGELTIGGGRWSSPAPPPRGRPGPAGCTAARSAPTSRRPAVLARRIARPGVARAGLGAGADRRRPARGGARRDATRRVRATLPARRFEPPVAARVPLATSATLIGYRHKRELARDDRHVVDEILYSVANHGDAPVEVTIEEELRYPGAAVVRFERPAAGEGGGALKRDRWRRVVTVAPDGVARGAVVVQYRTPQP